MLYTLLTFSSNTEISNNKIYALLVLVRILSMCRHAASFYHKILEQFQTIRICIWYEVSIMQWCLFIINLATLMQNIWDILRFSQTSPWWRPVTTETCSCWQTHITTETCSFWQTHVSRDGYWLNETDTLIPVQLKGTTVSNYEYFNTFLLFLRQTVRW